ncbi:MAG: class 1 fructose-bisphosphatase [Deltaproteobacteria bacterium]|nr:class 1 fructose-bisphosphatase [Deltaproteobacteria bacterium]
MPDRSGVTVTEHILVHQKEAPGATGVLSGILNELIVAAKIISREVTKAGLVDVLGFTGERNVQDEEVRKLDDYANNIIVRRLQQSGHLCLMSSEEVADPIEIPNQYPQGGYVLTFDPLDGSSNIDANVSIGTIFSVHRRVSSGEPGLDDILQPGYKQVAAGYFIYGSSTMLVYTTGNGVWGFTLDPSVGEFLLSHPEIRIPEKGKIYSVNEAYSHFWHPEMLRYMDHLKDPNKCGRNYSSRYIGSLVADFHRNLLYGGIFMYPADKKDPHKPHGKLRLLCEAAPLALIVQQAGGHATTGTEPILKIEPTEIHQRVPLFIGSLKDVETAESFMSGKAA